MSLSDLWLRNARLLRRECRLALKAASDRTVYDNAAFNRTWERNKQLHGAVSMHVAVRDGDALLLLADLSELFDAILLLASFVSMPGAAYGMSCVMRLVPTDAQRHALEQGGNLPVATLVQALPMAVRPSVTGETPVHLGRVSGTRPYFWPDQHRWGRVPERLHVAAAVILVLSRLQQNEAEHVARLEDDRDDYFAQGG